MLPMGPVAPLAPVCPARPVAPGLPGRPLGPSTYWLSTVLRNPGGPEIYVMEIILQFVIDVRYL